LPPFDLAKGGEGWPKLVQLGTKLWRDCSLFNSVQGDAFMAGILLWLMGVPLIVIILLYLIF
jgi:hypothetical protein